MAELKRGIAFKEFVFGSGFLTNNDEIWTRGTSRLLRRAYHGYLTAVKEKLEREHPEVAAAIVASIGVSKL